MVLNWIWKYVSNFVLIILVDFNYDQVFWSICSNVQID